VKQHLKYTKYLKNESRHVVLYLVT